jgi:hypothetical protein
MYLASPGSKNVIFAVLYESLKFEVFFTTDYVLGPHLWVIKSYGSG